MTQRQSSEELHRQAVPVLKDLAKIQTQHYGKIPVDSLIYAMVRHLSLTVAVVGERENDYREWINSLMDSFAHELEREPKQSAGG